ncbi:alpha-crystallin A chain-like [Acanthaster planci]|uniref:Alpha-crystallin A chain-like n=1 Tax=Acanthaster planci TaxID=133434 RepID=A0A8B7YIA5_ACAPL|nr:alpha-crystallin A chain-like [Acanthaster planci]
MSDVDIKSGGKKCPLGFSSGGEGSRGHSSCPYGFGRQSHGHGHGIGHGGLGHCPFLHAQGHSGHGYFGHGLGGHHGFDHHGISPILQCPWMIARMHACPWAWGVSSDHHGRHHGCKRGDFCVSLKVTEYCSEDLEVKVVGQEVIVHGKHGLRPDHPGDLGTVTREFTRCYPLPDEIDIETVTSSLNNHELIITATKKVAEGEPRVVPIQVGEEHSD